MEKLSQQKIKDLKKLQLKKHRDSEQLLYLEGETLVRDLCQEFPELIVSVIVNEDKSKDFESFSYPVLLATSRDLEKLSQQKTPKKVNAVVRYPLKSAWQKGPLKKFV